MSGSVSGIRERLVFLEERQEHVIATQPETTTTTTSPQPCPQPCPQPLDPSRVQKIESSSSSEESSEVEMPTSLLLSDLIGPICMNLDLGALVTVRLVSKEWHKIAKSILWKEHCIPSTLTFLSDLISAVREVKEDIKKFPENDNDEQKAVYSEQIEKLEVFISQLECKQLQLNKGNVPETLPGIFYEKFSILNEMASIFQSVPPKTVEQIYGHVLVPMLKRELSEEHHLLAQEAVSLMLEPNTSCLDPKKALGIDDAHPLWKTFNQIINHSVLGQWFQNIHKIQSRGFVPSELCNIEKLRSWKGPILGFSKVALLNWISGLKSGLNLLMNSGQFEKAWTLVEELRNTSEFPAGAKRGFERAWLSQLRIQLRNFIESNQFRDAWNLVKRVREDKELPPQTKEEIEKEWSKQLPKVVEEMTALGDVQNAHWLMAQTPEAQDGEVFSMDDIFSDWSGKDKDKS